MIYSMSLGILAGLFSGLLPAAGNFTTILILSPLLVKFDVYQLVLFYFTMAALSQYIGSVPAILFGIPGESSSLPAVIEGANLTWQEKINALIQTAIGSFLGTVTVFLMMWAFSGNLEGVVAKVYNSYTVSIMLSITAIMICMTTAGKWYLNVLKFFAGAALSMIGYNQFFGTSFTLGISYLSSGIPDSIIILMFFGFSEVYQSMFLTKQSLRTGSNTVWKLSPPSIKTSAWAITIGTLAGFIPGLTTVASSNTAYSISKWLKNTSSEHIYASETANNAGVVSSMLPLLLFGIPILGSEAILLTLMTQKGFSLASFTLADITTTISKWFILANIIGVVLSLGVSKIMTFLTINLKISGALALIFMTSSVLYESVQNNRIGVDFMLILILAPISWSLRTTNNMPLIFGFLVCGIMSESIYRLFFL